MMFNSTIYSKSEYKLFFVIGLIFALLSGVRLPFLPELQFLGFICYIFLQRRVSYKVLLFLTTILCTHHYVIPDFVFRADGSDYPSIYTRAYGPIKILDILVVVLFIISLPLFIKKNIFKILYIRKLPTVFFFTSFVGIVFITSAQFSTDQFLFIMRSYILFFSIFIFSVNLSWDEIKTLSWLAIFCWITKMAMSILIPHQHPLTRTILGIDGVIFFAGDEYMTIPYYLAMIILIGSRNFSPKKIYITLLIVFILTMLAQRKGAIQILGLFTVLVYVYKNKSKFCREIVKFYFIFSGYITFLFLYNIDLLTSDPLILLAFDEYSNFAHISIKSLQRLYSDNPLGFLFGISPFGMYQVIDLPPYMDHMTSFGKEVGEFYRYQFWSFPLGRCILNVGAIGFIFVVLLMVRTIKYNLFIMYLVISAIPICYYTNLTPVTAFAMGIVFSFLYKFNSNRIQNTLQKKYEKFDVL